MDGHDRWDLEGEVPAHGLYKGEGRGEGAPTIVEQSLLVFPCISSLLPHAYALLFVAFAFGALASTCYHLLPWFSAMASSSSPPSPSGYFVWSLSPSSRR